MAKTIEVKGPFDHSECYDCPVRDVCKAGIFVLSTMQTMETEADAIFGSFKDDMLGSVVDLYEQDDPTIIAAALGKEMTKAKNRYLMVGRNVNAMLGAGVDAQNADDCHHIELNARRQKLEDAVDDFSLSPLPGAELLTPETLQGMADSVLHYSKVEVCDAIELTFA
jgi:hypothetical protein